mmetsp:Transcript_30861/g.71619  ORF Transcript_30861/g.71619 Transcript_30861/m.71619 type:complete len:160 (-) Transcript_30861:120-599(-)
MAMDSCLTAIMRETMYKEQKFLKKWKDQERAAREAEDGPRPMPAFMPKKSCQVNQLEQTMRLQGNPHVGYIRGRPHEDAQAMLRYGVSRDGQGRAAYLDHEGRRDPKLRYGAQVTTTHEYGWTAQAATKNYTSSPFARRPLVKNQFYRPMGVSFSTGAL